jgi:ATP-dependent DNA ligase
MQWVIIRRGAQRSASTSIPVLDRLRFGRQPQTEAVLFAFDLLELGGKDLRRAPLEERKRAPAKLVRRGSDRCRLVDKPP